MCSWITCSEVSYYWLGSTRPGDGGRDRRQTKCWVVGHSLSNSTIVHGLSVNSAFTAGVVLKVEDARTKLLTAKWSASAARRLFHNLLTPFVSRVTTRFYIRMVKFWRSM